MDEHRRTRARNGATEAVNAAKAMKAGGKGSEKGAKTQGRGSQSGYQSWWPYTQQANAPQADGGDSWRGGGQRAPFEKNSGQEKTFPWMRRR